MKPTKITLSLEDVKQILINELYLIPYEETVEITITEKGITLNYLE